MYYNYVLIAMYIDTESCTDDNKFDLIYNKITCCCAFDDWLLLCKALLHYYIIISHSTSVSAAFTLC